MQSRFFGEKHQIEVIDQNRFPGIATESQIEAEIWKKNANSSIESNILKILDDNCLNLLLVELTLVICLDHSPNCICFREEP